MRQTNVRDSVLELSYAIDLLLKGTASVYQR